MRFSQLFFTTTCYVILLPALASAQNVTASSNLVFEIIDLDSDGAFSQQEIAGAGETLLTFFDKDGDGAVSADEFQAAKELKNVANQGAALALSKVLKNACKVYKLNTGKFPTHLNDLMVKPEAMELRTWRGPYLDLDSLPNDKIVDTWGNEFAYTPDEENS